MGSSPFPYGHSKKDRTKYDPYGGLPFPTFAVSLGKEKSLAYRRSHFSEPMGSSQSVRCHHTAKKAGLNPVFLLVTLNQPKSNLSAGNSDTLKREPSESVGDKSPRANRCILHHSHMGHQKAKILKQTVFALGFCW